MCSGSRVKGALQYWQHTCPLVSQPDVLHKCTFCVPAGDSPAREVLLTCQSLMRPAQAAAGEHGGSVAALQAVVPQTSTSLIVEPL